MFYYVTFKIRRVHAAGLESDDEDDDEVDEHERKRHAEIEESDEAGLVENLAGAIGFQ